MSRIFTSVAEAVASAVTILAVFAILPATEAKGIDLSPELNLSLSGHSSVEERGLRLSDQLAFSAACELKYDPIAVALEAGLLDDDPSTRLSYDLAYLFEVPGGAAGAGVRGSSFDYSSELALEDRHEVYLSVGSDPTRASRIRWRLCCAQVLDGDGALYADVRLAATERLAARVDCDFELGLGWGDEDFAHRQLSSVVEEPVSLDAWVYAEGVVSAPIMLGRFDFVPSVHFSAVIDGSARDVLEQAGADKEFWRFSLAAIFYLD